MMYETPVIESLGSVADFTQTKCFTLQQDDIFGFIPVGGCAVTS